MTTRLSTRVYRNELIAVAALAAIGMVTAEARAEAVWQGELIVKTVGQGCTSWKPGDFASAVFRPAGLDDNGPDSYFSILQPHRGLSLRIIGASFVGDGDYSATMIGGNGKGSSYDHQFKSVTSQPANPTTATTSLSVAGTIYRIENVKNCFVSFNAVFVRKP